MAYLRSMGLEVIEGPCASRRQAYRSAPILERANEFNDFLRNPEIKAIISAIGGTNSNSLLPYLDYDALRQNPKIIMGYSDVTALLLAIYSQTNLVTFYGPAVVPSFGEYPEMLWDGRRYFENVAMGRRSAPYALDVPKFWTEEVIPWEDQHRPKSLKVNTGWEPLKAGKATGPLIGGNLNTLSGIMASRYFPDVTGAILFIEDSWKDLATEERLFSMLKVSGVFDKISGLIVGKHEHLDTQQAPFSLQDLLLEVLGDVDFPVLAEVDVGHTFPSHVFPIGIRVSLNTHDASITFLEDAVL